MKSADDRIGNIKFSLILEKYINCNNFKNIIYCWFFSEIILIWCISQYFNFHFQSKIFFMEISFNFSSCICFENKNNKHGRKFWLIREIEIWYLKDGNCKINYMCIKKLLKNECPISFRMSEIFRNCCA